MLPEPRVLAPYSVRWDDASSSPTDVSFLLDPPAGKHGFARVEGGHIYVGDKRLRLWGTNHTFDGPMPPKAHAAAAVGHLAKLGINCVRLHHMDNRAPRGFLAADTPDTQHFDAEQLDRLDYYLAECFRQGIYVDLNLKVTRRFTEADGVRDAELVGNAKAASHFNRRLIELQKQFARDLLTHLNPYTGRTYAEEPAIVIVEFTNEDYLTGAWPLGWLQGKRNEPTQQILVDIPPSYAAELTDLYNAWLRERYPTRDALAEAWRGQPGQTGLGYDEDPAAGTVRRTDVREAGRYSVARFRSEAAFYMEVERRYYDEMRRCVRDEIGSKGLLLSTSDWNHRWSGLPLLRNAATLDVVDGHTYWQHPRYTLLPGGARSATDWTITNTPMVSEPNRSTVTQLARSAIVGKPYIVSEVNHPFPNEYACEGWLSLAAYAALQDWDGVFWYAHAHTSRDIPEHVANYFDTHADPLRSAMTAVGALLFLRGDVRPARQVVELLYTRTDVLDSNRVVADEKENPNWIPGLSPRLPLVHRLRIGDLNAMTSEREYPNPGNAPRIVSDTGELTWDVSDPAAATITVDTPRSQALIGFLGGRRVEAASLVAEVDTPFACVSLTSLGEQPIASADRLLLFAGARVANTGMVWDERRQSIGDRWGGPPTAIEPVEGRVTLRGLEGASRVTVQPLDSSGAPLAEPTEARQSEAGWALDLAAEPATLWYLVAVDRQSLG